MYKRQTLSVPPTFRVKSPDGDWLAGPAVASYARGWTTVKVYEDALNYDKDVYKRQIFVGTDFQFVCSGFVTNNDAMLVHL